MAEKSVADAVLARLERGEDIGDALRDDIERHDGVFFREWARTTDGWQGIATPAGGAGTAEEAAPRPTRKDEPLNILIYVISDYGHDRDDDEVGGQAYVSLIKDTFPNARLNPKGISKLEDDVHSDTSNETFARDMDWVTIEAAQNDVEYDQIHFMGHGRPVDGVVFEGKPFDRRELTRKKVTSLPLKDDGVIILQGCFTESGPFYGWAVDMAGGEKERVCAFEDLCVILWDYVEKEGKTTGYTYWDAEGNDDLMKIYRALGLEGDE
jgi:hypothetical protein